MSKAEALLLSLTENVHTHEHVVTDNDSYFVINPDTHEIENASRTKNVIMQYDHNSEKFTFELARYVEGHDMMLCNRVRVHFNNIDGTTLEENADVAELYDLAPCPDDDNKVVCSWSITRQATQLAGTLNFLVQYECIDDAGETVYEWHTDIYDRVEVRKGRNNSEQAIVEYSNILEQWYQRIFGTGESVMVDIANEGAAQIAAITAEGEKQVADVKAEGDAQKEAVVLKGEETLATIPEDYTTTYNMAEEALRKKANAIELEAEGESIFVDDASDAHLLGLKLYGNTAQKTTTGAQLIPQPYYESSKTSNGVKFTVNVDGSITMSGASTATELASCYFTMNPGMSLSGTYTYKCYGLPSNCVTNIYYIGDVIGEEERTMNLTEGNNYGFVIRVQPNTNVNATIYPMLVAGDTIKPYEPYTGGLPSPSPEYSQELESVENPVVSVYCKNLLDNLDVVRTVQADVTIDGNRIYVKKTNPENIYSNFYYNLGEWRALEGKTITVQVENVTDYTWHMSVGELTESNSWVSTSTLISRGAVGGTKSMFTITVPKNANAKYFGLRFVSSDASISDETYILQNLQVELGDTATDYEPYKPVQSMTINRTLHGIPVTSGGNYTDVNGQRWVCDEIDFERGVYMQRILDYVFTGDENWYLHDSGRFYASIGNMLGYTFKSQCSICSHVSMSNSSKSGYYGGNGTNGFYFNKNELFASADDLAEFLKNNAVGVLIALATPIETTLTEEELAYYKKLKTNYHNTTVMNDCNAHMAIKYAADTLIYMRDHQPKPTDEQVQSAVNEYASQNGVQIPSDDHIREIAKKSGGEVLTDDEVAALLSLLN